ncbi:glycosyltransferase family 39 protein [Candidatus Woesearchaeota archaeon]|nr:glycosyltransferase family 39 protein [Candidatus Woesearchaeota archaeon]
MDKYTKYSVCIIILFSIIVLSLASVYRVSGDGCWHIPAGKFIADEKRFPLFEPLGRDEPFWSPPMYHIIIATAYFIFGNISHAGANLAAKLVSPAFGILAIVFSFLTVKNLYNSKIAFYSTVFLAFIPIFIDYSVLSYAESTLMFFAVLSVYFLARGNVLLSGAAAGLAILAKYNGILIIPVLLFILCKKHEKKFLRNAAILVIVPLLVASPWLIRNWALLGNPVWPFLNFLFKGYEAKSYSAFDYGRLTSPYLFISTYLGFFGVPDGNYTLVSGLGGYIKTLFPIWILGTFIFIIPLLAGLFVKKTGKKDILFVWLACFFALFLVYVANVGILVSRIILPGLIPLAVFWAFGLERLLLNEKLRKAIPFLISLAIIGLVFALFAKFYTAAGYWAVYKPDFEWARENTPVDSVFIASGQCVPYNIERASLYATGENIKKADYIWVNQNFWLDRISIYDESTLKEVQALNYPKAYENKRTSTIIYKAKK